MVRRDSEQDTHKAKIFSPTDTSSLRTGTQSTERKGTDNVRKRRDGDHICLRRSIFTQRVDDPHGQLNAEEHEGPACSPQAPGLHPVILVLFGKDLLQKTTQTAVRGSKPPT